MSLGDNLIPHEIQQVNKFGLSEAVTQSLRLKFDFAPTIRLVWLQLLDCCSRANQSVPSFPDDVLPPVPCEAAEPMMNQA